MTRPEDETGGDPGPLTEWGTLGSHDESDLIDELGRLLDDLAAPPDLPLLDYGDIWRRIDRDIG